MNKLGKAFLSLFLDKKARASLAHKRAAQPARGSRNKRDENIQDIQTSTNHVMTPARQQIIQDAMKVRAAKAKVLDDLSDEQKKKLYALAIKSLLNEGRDDKG